MGFALVKYISRNLYRKMIDFALSEGLERNCPISFVISVDSLEKSQSVRADQFSNFTKN
jgi:hypothetical protein